MPLTGTALKRFTLAERNRKRNQSVTSEVKTRVKAARAAIADDPNTAGDAVAFAMRKLDKAASKGVIHKRAAARRRSRLQRRLNTALAGRSE